MLVAGDRNLERSGGEQSEGACQGITAENQQSVGIFGKSAINRDFFGKSAEIRQKLTGRHKEHCLFIKSIGYQKSYESEQIDIYIKSYQNASWLQMDCSVKTQEKRLRDFEFSRQGKGETGWLVGWLDVGKFDPCCTFASSLSSSSSSSVCWQGRLCGVPLLHFWPVHHHSLGSYVSPQSPHLPLFSGRCQDFSGLTARQGVLM